MDIIQVGFYTSSLGSISPVQFTGKYGTYTVNYFFLEDWDYDGGTLYMAFAEEYTGQLTLKIASAEQTLTMKDGYCEVTAGAIFNLLDNQRNSKKSATYTLKYKFV